MARIRQTISGSTGASENSIVFFPAGGHSHNGNNSSLIDTTAYSIYDFSPSFVGTDINRDRSIRQESNRIAFEDLIKRVVNSSVLEPAGIRLNPGAFNGNVINANTITANEIASNTVTADNLVSNIVLINNVIRSSNYAAGSAGWIISNTGSAEFNQVTVRGTIAATSGNIAGWTINTSNITGGSTILYSNGYINAASGSFTGTISASSGSIGGWTINSGNITGGSTVLYSNGYINATSGSFTGSISASSGSVGGWSISSSYISGGSTTLYSNGRIVSTTGRFGPLELSSSGFSSENYSSTNYFRLENYGDLLIRSNPSSGPHIGLYHQTIVGGEYIEIKRTNSSWVGQNTSAFIGFYDSTNMAEMSLVDSTGTVQVKATSTGTFTAVVKNFKIQHPLYDDKYLVHSSLEGPSIDVFYRGKGKTINGIAEIELPNYFEALTKEENRTIIITPIFNNNYENFTLAVNKINNGKFNVFVLSNQPVSDQEFHWFVQATRKNAELEVEPSKTNDEIRIPNN